MTTCHYCGEEIEFIHNGFGVIPIHPSGSCSGRSGGFSGWSGGSGLRITESGEFFQFPFLTYPSYVNPNARCPVCGASVYFYQSPNGGRVFFDELGPPWPKHPCTDNPVVQRGFASSEGGKRFLIADSCDSGKPVLSSGESDEVDEANLRTIPWVEAGWMPFVVTRIVARSVGIEAEGNLFLSAGSEPVRISIIQNSNDARFYKIKGQLRIGFDLVQNASQITAVLNECPILLKKDKDPNLDNLILSSFILSRSGEIEEISLSVTTGPA